VVVFENDEECGRVDIEALEVAEVKDVVEVEAGEEEVGRMF
jgi:hypothetical protein